MCQTVVLYNYAVIICHACYVSNFKEKGLFPLLWISVLLVSQRDLTSVPQEMLLISVMSGMENQDLLMKRKHRMKMTKKKI